jgi:hypothetical protein
MSTPKTKWVWYRQNIRYSKEPDGATWKPFAVTLQKTNHTTEEIIWWKRKEIWDTKKDKWIPHSED